MDGSACRLRPVVRVCVGAGKLTEVFVAVPSCSPLWRMHEYSENGAWTRGGADAPGSPGGELRHGDSLFAGSVPAGCKGARRRGGIGEVT